MSGHPVLPRPSRDEPQLAFPELPTIAVLLQIADLDADKRRSCLPVDDLS